MNPSPSRSNHSPRPAQGAALRRGGEKAPVPDRRRERSRRLFFLALLIETVTLGFTAYILYTLSRYEILPVKYRLPITLVLVLANVYFVVLLRLGAKRVGIRLAGIALSLLVLLGSVFLSNYLGRAIAAMNHVTELADETVQVKKVEMSIRVLKNSTITGVEALKDAEVLAPYSRDKVNIDLFFTAFTKESKVTFKIKEVDSYLDAVNQLYIGAGDVILFNKDYLSVILEKYPEFESQTREISSSMLAKENAVNSQKVETAKEAFNVFISGIDTYGPIETSSRSDVNILVSVNPNTKIILMTNIPRDMYMRIPGEGENEYDKLTHAGIYGVPTSVAAVENFLGVAINYYVKVNFTSVITLVDLIGGIEVDNPYPFEAYGENFFPAGPQHLDGEKTLVYARERYNLLDGDNDRGKNQERILAGIFRKLLSAELLKNFSSLIEIAQNSMQTTMSVNDMMKLVNLQLGSDSKWTIITSSIAGDGQYGWSSFAAPGYDVYVQIPDEASVAAAKAQIRDILMGGNGMTGQTTEQSEAGVSPANEPAAEAAPEADTSEAGSEGDEADAD